MLRLIRKQRRGELEGLGEEECHALACGIARRVLLERGRRGRRRRGWEATGGARGCSGFQRLACCPCDQVEERDWWEHVRRLIGPDLADVARRLEVASLREVARECRVAVRLVRCWCARATRIRRAAARGRWLPPLPSKADLRAMHPKARVLRLYASGCADPEILHVLHLAGLWSESASAVRKTRQRAHLPAWPVSEPVVPRDNR